MAEQLLFGTADRMIGTLGSLAAKEIGLQWGVEDELRSLRNTVSTVKAVLLDAEEKQAAGNHAVRDWLGKLEDAMYEADDLLDAVSTEALRREVMTRDKKAKQVRIFFSKSNQLAFGLTMAHKIKAMRQRLDAINADRRFHLEERRVETRVGGKRDNTHSIVCAEAVIGRDKDKKAVIDRLLDSNVEENVTIHPIVGIGGLGKTILMHDLAISVAGSMITSLDGKEKKVDEKTRHVSIVGSDIDALSITTSLCKASSMRTFLRPIYLSHNRIRWGESDCKAIFSSSKFLRVLVLPKTNRDFLPSSIGKLKHLRYLDLSWNDNLKKLPNSITRLQNLQTLILSFCENLEELPRDIRKLVHLRHLEIYGCDRLTYMPRGLGQLTNLQTLSNFVVDKDPLSRYSSGLRELNGFNNLRGELCIQNLRHGKDVASECEAANLKEKKHLHGLHLQWSIEGGGNDSDVNVDDEMLLEVLQPQPNLKQLRLEGNFCSRLPSWLSSLTNLVRFELIECRNCQYLPPLSQLPSLNYLYLSNLDALEYISDSNDFSSSSSASVPFFPSLEEIWFFNCPNLKGWWRRRDSSVEVNSDTNNSIEITEHPLLPSFPCLSVLWISNCPMLTSMPMFPHLEEWLWLENASWKPVQQTMMMNMAAPQSPTSTATASSSSTPLSKLKSIQLDCIPDLETLPEEGLKNLTSLGSLAILHCNRLNSLSPGIQHLTALQYLDLDDCPELELANDEDGMQWQGLKSLLSLGFSHLPKLVSLPLGLQHVTTLQRLKISNCENWTAIPEWIHNCRSLQALEIDGCSSLTSLPEGMRSLTSLQRLKIKDCPILLQRCEREAGEDWPKIAHIPELDLKNSNSDAEVAEPAKAQKKQRIWSIFKKSRALNS